jgi:nucleoside-diphosphate-sugar epimerase
MRVRIDEDHPLERQSRYAATKIGADQLALSFLRSFETPVVVARPFNTFGPRQSARAVIPTLITQALALESVELGSTHPTRDFLYVEDLARGFRRCVEADGVEGEVINLGTGTEISIADLAETVLRLVGWESALSYSEDRARTAAERGRAAAGRHEQGAAAPGLVARGLPRGGPAADDRVVARLARRLQAFDLQRLAR